MKYLITGGAGFIGANFCHYIFNDSDSFFCLDALTYAGNKDYLGRLLDKPNFHFIHGNICDGELIDSLFAIERFDYVINFAAESHVDNSIHNPQIFIDTNITGVRVLLDACKKYGTKRFHQVSTDEVYGELPLDAPAFTEKSELKPTSPYSITKATADLLTLSYHKAFGLDVTISRCSNNYGIFQHTEKFIPKTINSILHNENITLHGDGQNSRDWIHVLDHCEGINTILQNGKSGEIYNIGSHNEQTNESIAKIILKQFTNTPSQIEYVKDRPINDSRYAINYDKISTQLGYQPKQTFDSSLPHIIAWYKEKLK